MFNTKELRDILEDLFEDEVVYRVNEEEIYGVWTYNNTPTHTLIMFDDTYLLYDKPEDLKRLNFMACSPEIISKLLDEIDRLQEYEYKYNSCSE